MRRTLPVAQAVRMHLEEYDADDAAAVRRAVAVLEDAREADAPWHPPTTERGHAGEMRHGWDGELGRRFLAFAGSAVVGECSLFASEWDNLDRVELDITVPPAARRNGHGSAALGLLLDDVRTLGRHLVGGSGWGSCPAGAFAAAHGFRMVSRDLVRRLDLDRLDPAALESTYDEAAAAADDYELVRLEGRTPEELLGGVADLSAAINDAPVDDMDYDDEVHPPARVRAYESAQLARGGRFRRVVARCRTTGELAGHTVIVVDAEQPELAEQHDTAVLRSHRGHRLGLLLKADMLRWLSEAEPQLRAIETGNAASNRHMIAVNERLGYRVVGEEEQFEIRLPDPSLRGSSAR